MLLFRFEELGLFFFIPCQAAINLRQTSPSHTMSKRQNLVKPNATVVYQNKKAYKRLTVGRQKPQYTTKHKTQSLSRGAQWVSNLMLLWSSDGFAEQSIIRQWCFKGQWIVFYSCYIFVTYRRRELEARTHLDRSSVYHWTNTHTHTSSTPDNIKCVSVFLVSVLTPLKRPRSWIWRMKYSPCSSSARHVLKLPPFSNFNRWQRGNSHSFTICAKTTFSFLFPVQIWSQLVTGFSCKAFKGNSKHSVMQISANLGKSPIICYFDRRLFFSPKLNM